MHPYRFVILFGGVYENRSVFLIVSKAPKPLPKLVTAAAPLVTVCLKLFKVVAAGSLRSATKGAACRRTVGVMQMCLSFILKEAFQAVQDGTISFGVDFGLLCLGYITQNRRGELSLLLIRVVVIIWSDIEMKLIIQIKPVI